LQIFQSNSSIKMDRELLNLENNVTLVVTSRISQDTNTINRCVSQKMAEQQ
jgi:phosphoketolase